MALALGIIGLPLLGFLINFLGRNYFKKPTSGYIASTMMGGAFVLALLSTRFYSAPLSLAFFPWFSIGSIHASYGILIDGLSLWMSFVITGVGTLIHIYSIGYMADDPRFNSYFSYLNLFVFFMLVLVFSHSYLGVFIGWEGVGLSSYVLIGFWYQNTAYNLAAKKAFIMNRIGDAGFLFAIMSLFMIFGTTDFSVVLPGASGLSQYGLLFVCMGLIVGMMGKSAQVPLFTWLPDAMAGPTPVSALIHAATMVTAGIYLIARSSLLFNLSVPIQTILLFVGVATALLGALFAVTQSDIKKILAYSTMSQLGFMVTACALGAYSAALFHMTTHAFFKALLFLAAGNVIHGLHGEQDIFKMGNLRKSLPITYRLFAIGTLAIVGFPPLAGFFSKDEILIASAGHSWALFSILAGISILTAFYMFRLFFLVFFGQSRSDHSSVHEAGSAMTAPLVCLAALTIVAGLFNTEPAHYFTHFISDSVRDLTIREVPLGFMLTISSVVLLLAIMGSCYALFAKRTVVTTPNKGFVFSFFNHTFYIDSLYDRLFVKPYLWISGILYTYAELFLNRLGQLLVVITTESTAMFHFLQSGYVSMYILVFVFSIVVMLGALVR